MVDDDGRRRTTDRTPDHGHPISSPCEPNGSGELKFHWLFEDNETDQGDCLTAFGYLKK